MKERRTSNLNKLRLTAVAVAFCSAPLAYASSKVMPVFETYESTRSAGMAGASAAVADDENAIFSNPAGIGQEDNPKLILRGFAIPNLALGVNQTTYRLLNDFGQTQKSGFKNLENLLDPNQNTILFFRGSTFPYITISRFQFGLLVDAAALGYQTMGSSVPGGVSWDRHLEAWQRSQAGSVVGFSVPWRDTGASVGLTGRYMFRTSYFETITVSGTDVQKTENPINKTKGLAWDLGFQLAPKKSAIPSVSFAIRDVGNTVYQGIKSTDTTEIEKANVMVGVLWKAPLGRQSGPQLLFTGEGHHLNDSRVETKDKFRFGSELRLGERVTPTPFSLRLGHNLSGFAYGATLDLLLLKAEFGSYVSPVQTSSGHQLDRRNFARLTVDLRD